VRANTATELPSGENARSRPSAGAVVKPCATRYSYLVVYPLVRFLYSRAEDPHVHVLLVGREGGDKLARGRHRRGRLAALCRLALDLERAPVLARTTTVLVRKVLLPQPAAEPGVELFDIDVERLLQHLYRVAAPGATECEHEVAHPFLAVLVLDELEHLVTVPIRDESTRRGRHRRDDVRQYRVAHVHLVAGCFVVGEVRCHALHEPLRRAGVDGAPAAPLKQDLVLEDVGQLVLDQRLQLGI
jgi:hypothetical protein